MSKYRKSFTVDGRRHYVRANTKRELDEKIGRLKAELDAGRPTNRKNITVGEWARGWVDTYKPDASRSYRRGIENILRKLVAEYGDVPIPDVLAERLKSVVRRPEDRLLVYSTGHPYNRFYVNLSWDSFKQCMRQLSGSIADDLVLYDLRHTYCTNLQAAGVPINIARELMGHSSIKMTATIYTHHSDAAVESAREKINNFDRANRVPDARQ